MGKNSASNAAADARKAEEARQVRVREGTEKIDQTFEQFDDSYFSGLGQGYVDYAQPDLEKQYADANRETVFNLARAGTLDSSIRSETMGDLNEAHQTALQGLYDKGREYETNSRNAVEDARSDLVSQLQVTGDAEGAANAALARSSALATPPAYSPIGQLFQDFTSGLSTQAAIERAEAFGSPIKSRYSTGLFGASPNAVSVS